MRRSYLLLDLSAAIIEIDATPGEDESADAIRAFAVHDECGNEQGERGDAGYDAREKVALRKPLKVLVTR